MSVFSTNLVNTYTKSVQGLQKQIATVKAELASGKNTLTPAQESSVATLSSTVKSYSTPQTSIEAAQKTIGIAQTAIKSILPLINQMQQLAQQASNPGVGSSDSANFDFRFRQILVEVGKLAVSASLNGNNLLSGSAGMNVVTGIDKSASSRFFINSVDIYAMMNLGILSGVKLYTPTDAQAAIGALNSARAQITNGQFNLNMTANTLTAKAKKLTDSSAATQQSINAIQDIDPAKLKTQLTRLQNQKDIDYQLIQQLDPAAYNTLKVAELTSLAKASVKAIV